MVYTPHNSARRIKRKVESFERARAERLPPDAVLASPFGQQPFTTDTRVREAKSLYGCEASEIVEIAVQAARACADKGMEPFRVSRVSWLVLAPFREVFTDDALRQIHAAALERVHEQA